MKDLSLVSAEEQKLFFDSFDSVLCSVDGVLWLHSKRIPGSTDGIKCLQNAGKKVFFLSNDTTTSPEFYCEQLNIEKSQMITPVSAIISHLKKSNLNKEVYVIGMAPLRTALEAAGFKLAEYVPDLELESLDQYVRLSLANDDKVGAVVADVDIRTNRVILNKAVIHLKKSDVIFITGRSEQVLHVGPGQTIIGPKYFNEMLEDMTGRKSTHLAKPGLAYNEFIKEKFQLGDPSRVLFIGDSVVEDMGFAANCGYKKLLVLSDLTKTAVLEEWKFPDEHKPEYYVHSLEFVRDILAEMIAQ